MAKELDIDLYFGPRSVKALFAAVLLFATATDLGSENVTLTTYYPAPSGVYNRMSTTGNTYLATSNTAGNVGMVGVGTTAPTYKLDILPPAGTPGLRVQSGGVMLTNSNGNQLQWGNGSLLQTDQGGSIELGGNNGTAGLGTPYIDFHLSGFAQDYNARIINDANGWLSFYAGSGAILMRLKNGIVQMGSGCSTIGFGDSGSTTSCPANTIAVAVSYSGGGVTVYGIDPASPQCAPAGGQNYGNSATILGSGTMTCCPIQ